MSPRNKRRGTKSMNETNSETISKKMEEDTPTEPQQTRKTRAKPTNKTILETIQKEEETPVATPGIRRSRRRAVNTSLLESSVAQLHETSKLMDDTVQKTPMRKTLRSRKHAALESTINESNGEVETKTKRTRRGKENESVTEQKTILESTINESHSKVETKRRRTRRGKENKSLTEEQTLLETTNTQDSIVNKSRGTRARKKDAKKTNTKSEDESTEVVINEKSNVNAAKIIETGINDDDDDAIPMSIEDAEVHRVSDIISRLKAATVLPRKRRRDAILPIEECTPESSPITVNLTPHRTTKTPTKSPININSPKSHGETSLRLSKTPRKLPVVAESPATSEKSITSSIEGTPIKSPKNDTNNRRSPKSSKNKHVPMRKLSKSPKIVLRSPKSKSSKSKSPRVVATKVKKISLSKSSIKSPTRSNKSSNKNQSTSLGKKSLSPKNVGESLKRKKSPGSSINLSRNGSLTSGGESPNVSTKPSTRSEQLTHSPMVHLNQWPVYNVDTPETVTITRSGKKTPSDDSTKSTPTKSQSAEKRSSQGGESPRRAKSVGKKRGPITDSGTPLRPIDTPMGSAVKQSAGESIILSSSSPRPVNTARGKFISGLIDSSTPHKRIRRSLNLSPDLRSPNLGKLDTNSSTNRPTPIGTSTMINESRGKRRRSMPIEDESYSLFVKDNENSFNCKTRLNGSYKVEATVITEKDDEQLNINTLTNCPPTPIGSSTMLNDSRGKRRSMRIEDESNPSIMSDDENSSNSKTHLNGTYEVDATVVTEKEDEQPVNGTYELAEPKTPNLRRKTAKRSISEMDTSSEERAAKRTCRVRFASPQADHNKKKTEATVVGKPRSATPAHPTGIFRFGGKVSTSASSDKVRRRSNSMSNVSLTSTPLVKRRSKSVTDGTDNTPSKKVQSASKPSFSIGLSAKKQKLNTPVARKAPNFANIHKKTFAKMESLVDAKKRVEERHLAAMTTSQIPTSLAKTPTDNAKTKPTVPAKSVSSQTAVNGAYNRYGFKLKKVDVVKMISQKQAPVNSEKKQNETRMFLKGVRTNRRFELAMKARNINR